MTDQDTAGQRSGRAGRRPARRAAALAGVLGAAIALAATAAPAVADTSTSSSTSSSSTSASTASTVTGTLVRAYAESPDPSTDHRLLTWVQTGSDDVRVPTTDTDVSSVPTGARVRIRLGRALTDVTSREGGEEARDVLGAKVLAAASSPGATSTGTSSAGATGSGTAAASTSADGTISTTPVVHQVTVVMAVPAGGTRDSATAAQVDAEVAGAVHEYWSGSSAGRIDLQVVKTVDWVQLSSGCSSPTAMWDEAAADAGWTAGADKHLVVYLSSTPSSLSGCSDGLAEVGSGLDAGGRLYVRSTDADVLAHELGHNFGLMHAAEEQCDGVVEGTSAQCRETTYRDLYDVMAASWGPLGALSGFQSTQLGFMPTAQRRDVSTSGGSGVVSLAPVGASSGVRAVRLTQAGGAVYWIEDREAVGRDAYLSTSANWVGLKTGVVVRREGSTSAGEDATELLDATPSARAHWDTDEDVVVPVGTTIPLGTGGWYLTVRSCDTGGAVVDVRQGTAASAAATSLSVTRRAGEDRYATAAAVAAAAYPSGAATVVVASGAGFPDALAGGPAAALAGGPLLLVPSSGTLPAAVRTELSALHPSTITVIGGTASVGADVAAQLQSSAPVTRVSGTDRYATAAAVATAAPVTTGGTVYLASGTVFADALAGATAAAHTGARLLLTGDGPLPAATASALAALRPAHVVALGGTARISDAVLAAAAAPSGADTARWSGDDRYATAAVVAVHANGASASGVVLASGETFPDALAAAPLAAQLGQPLLLTRGACAPAGTVSAVAGLGAASATVVGGASSVSDGSAHLDPCA